MDIFFQDPEDIPVPPDEVRIREFTADPWPDGRRVRVYLEITPFQKRPNGEINIVDEEGEEVASISIIETIDPKMEFTIHLRSPERGGKYTVSSKVFYAQMESEEADEKNEARPAADPPPPPPMEVMVVDQAKTTFRIEDR